MKLDRIALVSTVSLVLTAVGCAAGDADPAPSQEEGTLAKTSAELRTPIACGGLRGLVCPRGYACVDDPRDTCDPLRGGADCIGVCVVATPRPCGGIAGIACPRGEMCIDDPRDACDPLRGGADCGGICVGVATTNGAPR